MHPFITCLLPIVNLIILEVDNLFLYAYNMPRINTNFDRLLSITNLITGRHINNGTGYEITCQRNHRWQTS